MKVQNFIKIAGLLALTVLVLACPSSFTPPKAGGASIPIGKGVVNLSIAGYDARTIFPDELDNFAYSVTFSSGGKTATEEIVNGTGSFTLDAPFTWTGLVEAKFDDVVVGIAELGEFTLLEGGTKEFKNILIQPAPGDDGTLSWAVEFPEDLTSAKLFYRAGETGTETEIDLLAASRVDLVSSGSINLEPGDYLFRAVLAFAANNLTAGKVEAVHIYPELNSTLEWSFPIDAFFEVEDVTVTVPINASSGINITGIVLNADDIAPINEYTNEGTDYIFVISKMRSDINNVNNLRLDITTDNSVVNVPAKNYVKAGGALDMDAVDIFKLVGTVSANGKVSVTVGTDAPVTYTQNFQLDLIKNTAGTVDAEADDLYKIDASSGIGPFTMTADVTVSAEFVREYYRITVATASNGTIDISGHVATPSFRALSGTTITVTLAADSSGFNLPEDGPVVSYQGGTVTVTGSGATWTFSMPAEDVTISASFSVSGYIQIYSGGPKFDLVATDIGGGTGGGTNGVWNYGGSVDEVIMEAPGEGRNGGSAITFNAGGTRTGESGFTLSCPTAFDTSFSGGLSFWMKASANSNTAWIGTGNNDWDKVITYFGEGHNQVIPVTTTWQRYIIPFPLPQASMNRVFIWKATPGTTVYYFDDFEFLPGADVKLTGITIPATAANEFPYPVPINLDALTTTPHVTTDRPMKFTFTHDGVTATLVSPGAQGNLGMQWNTVVPPSNYTYDVTGDVAIAGKTITPNDRGITFTASLTFRGITSNTMTGNFSAGGEVVTVPTVANGTIAVSPLDAASQAIPEETITITLTPNFGYIYQDNSLTITRTSGGAETVTPTRIGSTLQWTFEMPEFPVTIAFAFVQDTNMTVIEDFTTVTTFVGATEQGPTATGWWKTFGWTTIANDEPHIGNNTRITFSLTEISIGDRGSRPHPTLGRVLSGSNILDLSGKTEISLWVRFIQAQVEGNIFTFTLTNDTTASELNFGNVGENTFPYTPAAKSFTAEFTVAVHGQPERVDSYVEFVIPISEFSNGAGGVLNLSAITGWAFGIKPDGVTGDIITNGTGEQRIRLDTISARQ